MYIQERLRAFEKELENEFSSHSWFTLEELFGGSIVFQDVIQEGEPKMKNRIQSMYLFWLKMIVEKMSENPQYRHVSAIEGIMKLKYHDVTLVEIESMMIDFFNGTGLFLSTGGGTGFAYYSWHKTWSLADIAGCVKRLCDCYFKAFGKPMG